MGQDQPQALDQRGSPPAAFLYPEKNSVISDNTVQGQREQLDLSGPKGKKRGWTQSPKAGTEPRHPPYKPGTLPGSLRHELTILRPPGWCGDPLTPWAEYQEGPSWVTQTAHRLFTTRPRCKGLPGLTEEPQTGSYNWTTNGVLAQAQRQGRPYHIYFPSPPLSKARGGCEIPSKSTSTLEPSAHFPSSPWESHQTQQAAPQLHPPWPGRFCRACSAFSPAPHPPPHRSKPCSDALHTVHACCTHTRGHSSSPRPIPSPSERDLGGRMQHGAERVRCIHGISGAG